MGTHIRLGLVAMLPGMLEHDRRQAGWSVGTRRGRRIAPAPSYLRDGKAYLHCMQGSPFTMIGSDPALSATPSWGGLYWRWRASFGPPIESQAAA
jgi:hypothetical protein